MSAAISGIEINADDSVDGLLTWCKIFKSEQARFQCNGNQLPISPDRSTPSEQPRRLGSWGLSTSTFDIELSDMLFQVACGNGVSEGHRPCPRASLQIDVASLSAQGATLQHRFQHGTVELVDTRWKLRECRQLHETVGTASVGRMFTSSQSRHEVSDVVVTRPQVFLSTEGIVLLSNLSRYFHEETAARDQSVVVLSTEQTQDSPSAFCKLIMTDTSFGLVTNTLDPIITVKIESIRLDRCLESSPEHISHDGQTLEFHKSTRGAFSQLTLVISTHGASATDAPVVKVAALDFGFGRTSEDDRAYCVSLSLPQMETRFDFSQLDVTVKLAREMMAILESAQAPVEDVPPSKVATDMPMIACVEIGVVRFVVCCPSTTTTCAFTSDTTPKESCPATDYTLGISILRLSSAPGTPISWHSATCTSGFGMIGGIEVLTFGTATVESRKDSTLADLRNLCTADADHTASPENFAFSGGSDENESASASRRPRKEEAYWFSPVVSDSKKLWHVILSRVKLEHAHDFNMGLHVDHLQNSYHGARKLCQDLLNYNKKVSSESSANIVVDIKHLEFCIEDDPFEARLYLGHRLRAEEYDQQNARRLLLKARIEQLRTEGAARGIRLDSAWTKRAFSDLEAENSAIYCRRFQAIRPACSKSLLFTLRAKKVRVAFLHDDRLRGEENVSATIRTLDPKAEFPSEFLPNFTFARRIAAALESLEVEVRRFPRTPLLFRDVSISGVVILTSSSPWSDAHRQLARTVAISNLLEVHRDGMPLHFYHGLRMRARGIDYAWGANYDAALQQVAAKFDLLVSRGIVTHPNRGIAVPWFDRLRQLRHGPLELACDTLTLSVMTGQDPNVEDDFVDIQLAKLSAAWNSGKLTFCGDATAFLYPKSRFFGSPVLAISCLRGCVQTKWNCCGGTNFEQKPHTPELENFKSDGVDVTIQMERYDTQGICALLVHADTLRWIGRVYNDLFCVSRPRIKRGPLWQKFASPKLSTLGQHMLTTAIGVELSRAVFMYYDDLDRKYGMHVDVSHLVYETAYRQVVAEKTANNRKKSRREWQYTSEICEMAAVKSIAVSRMPAGSITGRYTKHNSTSEDDDSGSESECDDDAAPINSPLSESGLEELVSFGRGPEDKDNVYVPRLCF